MKQDSTLTVNWFRVNVPTIAAVIGGLWAVWSVNANLDKRITEIETSRVERSKEADNKFNTINTSISVLTQKIEPIANVTYRVGVVESQVQETNRRLDRLSEMILSSLETIRKDVNGLSTRVEVLSQKIDAISPPMQRSRLGQVPVVQ